MNRRPSGSTASQPSRLPEHTGKGTRASTAQSASRRRPESLRVWVDAISRRAASSRQQPGSHSEARAPRVHAYSTRCSPGFGRRAFANGPVGTRRTQKYRGVPRAHRSAEPAANVRPDDSSQKSGGAPPSTAYRQRVPQVEEIVQTQRVNGHPCRRRDDLITPSRRRRPAARDRGGSVEPTTR